MADLQELHKLLFILHCGIGGILKQFFDLRVLSLRGILCHFTVSGIVAADQVTQVLQVKNGYF